MTEKQKEYINRNLQAFLHNFGSVRIEKIPCAGFEIYFPANSDSFIMYCENIYAVDGWLYGCVQGFIRGEFKKAYEETNKNN